MERSKDILDVAYQAHAGVREKLCILNELVPLVNDENVWGRVQDVLDFFGRNIREHFAVEEGMIGLLRTNCKECSDAELRLLEEILEEHTIILDQFGRLQAAAAAYLANNDGKNKETFVALAHDIIDRLLPHADKEDNALYPLMRKSISAEQLNALKRGLSQGA